MNTIAPLEAYVSADTGSFSHTILDSRIDIDIIILYIYIVNMCICMYVYIYQYIYSYFVNMLLIDNNIYMIVLIRV